MKTQKCNTSRHGSSWVLFHLPACLLACLPACLLACLPACCSVPRSPSGLNSPPRWLLAWRLCWLLPLASTHASCPFLPPCLQFEGIDQDMEGQFYGASIEGALLPHLHGQAPGHRTRPACLGQPSLPALLHVSPFLLSFSCPVSPPFFSAALCPPVFSIACLSPSLCSGQSHGPSGRRAACI